MRVVLIKPSKAIAVAFAFASAVVFLALLKVVSSLTGNGSLLLIVVALLIVDAVATYLIFSLFMRQGQRTEALLSAVGISDDGISFSEELEFEYGVLNMKGWWGGGDSRSYHVSREFIRAGTARASSVPFVNAEFRMAVRGDGSGFVSAPAIRILSGPYRDVVLLFITEKGEVNADGTLLLSADSDSAQVTIKGEGREITGRVYATLSRARKVRVSVLTPENPYEFQIAEGRKFEFKHPMLPDEKILIVGNYKFLDPSNVLRKLGMEEIILGHGDFTLKATLDLPFRRDVSDSVGFTVSLEEKEEWGF